MANPNIDYATTNFEYFVLTKIHRIPTYESLHRIKNEIKANTSSVPCDLDGGNHWHLGLVLLHVEYTNVTPTPYARPVHPDIVNIEICITIYETTRLRNENKEENRLNREVNNVKKSLIKQLSKILQDLY